MMHEGDDPPRVRSVCLNDNIVVSWHRWAIIELLTVQTCMAINQMASSPI